MLFFPAKIKFPAKTEDITKNLNLTIFLKTSTSKSMAPSHPPPKLKQASMDSFLKVQAQVKAKVPSPSSPSDYEMLRQQTIRRNQEFLQKLGIAITKPNLSASSSSTSRTPINNRLKHSKPKPPPSTSPPRRSTRKRGPQPPPPPSSDHDHGDDDTGKRHLEFADSSVFRYACSEASSSLSFSSTSSLPSSHPIFGFETVGKTFHDPCLTKIYTLDVSFLNDDDHFLIAAGGHGGFISIFGGGGGGGGGEEEDEKPLMSWKGSRSWISGVMFLEKNTMMLVSSSNDGKVVVWDIKKQSAVSPPVVAEAGELHSGGIFSMHQLDGLLATASKDSSVGVSRITVAGEVVAERNASGHHSGAIRGVCFGDEKDKLADCGADGRICVLDMRLPQPCALTIESQHSTGVNTIEWSETNKFLLLSASKDPTLLLYDIRSSTEPILEFRNHVESNTRGTCDNIYRPSFVDGGKAVATPGQGSRKISLYSVDTGNLISQGMIVYDANLVRFTGGGGGGGGGGHAMLWAAGKQINQLCPLLQSSRKRSDIFE